jgi:hypothetical protein
MRSRKADVQLNADHADAVLQLMKPKSESLTLISPQFLPLVAYSSRQDKDNNNTSTTLLNVLLTSLFALPPSTSS